jgi:predicted AlkP superfamily pyrophosphatase or phosphodiesterase
MAFNSVQLTQTAATITQAMGLKKPKLAGEPIEPVLTMVGNRSRSGHAQKVLIYNPDAIAQWLYQKYTDIYSPVIERTQMAIPMLAAFPPVTPVCFATMFSGAEPKDHGIQEYIKKLVTVDTLFDALPRQGVRTALVARDDSSMGLIFTGRPITYFNTEPSDEEATRKGLQLLSENEHDVVVVYNMDYDDAIHDTEPESERSIQALKRHVRDFACLVDCAKKVWKDYDTLFLFAPDHGIHKTIFGNGDHYCDIPEDMNILHFYGFKPAGE